MATQESIIKLNGRVGGLTFYKNDRGYQVRVSKGIEPARIVKDPAFERSRENAAEFGRAVQTAKYLRNALRPLLLYCVDNSLTNRLHSRMLRVLQADDEHLRGERHILSQHTHMFRNFNFNTTAPLHETVLANYSFQIDLEANHIVFSVPPFRSKAAVVAPKHATHFQWIAAGLPVRFGLMDKDYELAHETSSILPLSGEITAPLSRVIPLSAPMPGTSVLILLGVYFFREMHGTVYPLLEKGVNPLGVVDVACI